jgi:hypothetical protein
MSACHDAALVCDALQATVAARGRVRMDAIIFTPTAAASMAHRLIDAIARPGLRRSMGAPARGWTTPSLSRSLPSKVELVDPCHYRTRAEARTSIFRRIARYNQRRLHYANDYLPPLVWEQRHYHNPLHQPSHVMVSGQRGSPVPRLHSHLDSPVRPQNGSHSA